MEPQWHKIHDLNYHVMFILHFENSFFFPFCSFGSTFSHLAYFLWYGCYYFIILVDLIWAFFWELSSLLVLILCLASHAALLFIYTLEFQGRGPTICENEVWSHPNLRRCPLVQEYSTGGSSKLRSRKASSNYASIT